MGIQPAAGRGEEPLRWTGIRPSSSARIPTRDFTSQPTNYFVVTIAGQLASHQCQLSRGLDRDKLPVMGKIWSMDAVAKNASTAFFGNASALAESPKKDG
jgi:hypothetical protein